MYLIGFLPQRPRLSFLAGFQIFISLTPRRHFIFFLFFFALEVYSLSIYLSIDLASSANHSSQPINFNSTLAIQSRLISMLVHSPITHQSVMKKKKKIKHGAPTGILIINSATQPSDIAEAPTSANDSFHLPLTTFKRQTTVFQRE